jgi:hypothetical protein
MSLVRLANIRIKPIMPKNLPDHWCEANLDQLRLFNQWESLKCRSRAISLGLCGLPPFHRRAWNPAVKSAMLPQYGGQLMTSWGKFTLGVKVVKSWDQLNQNFTSFETRAGLKWTSYLCTRWPQGPLLVLQSTRVPFVPWEPSQGQHFITQNIQLNVGLDS